MHYTTDQLRRRHGKIHWNDTTDCIYCGGVVEPVDYSESSQPNLSLPTHHFSCWHSGRFDGSQRYIVIGSSHDEQGDYSFPSLLRAMHQATDYARWNLDIYTYAVIDRETRQLCATYRGRCKTDSPFFKHLLDARR